MVNILQALIKFKSLSICGETSQKTEKWKMHFFFLQKKILQNLEWESERGSGLIWPSITPYSIIVL